MIRDKKTEQKTKIAQIEMDIKILKGLKAWFGDYSIYSTYTLKFQTSRRRNKVWTYPNWLR
jgi:hypothetical protein